MKLCLNYILLLLFSLALNWCMAETLEDCTKVQISSIYTNYTSTIIFDQDINKVNTQKEAVGDNTSINTSSLIPSIKYILRFTNTFIEHSPEKPLWKDNPFFHSSPYSSDRISYYIFGLRRIII